ncbi:hypothetical protein AB0904_12735 [Streptomyces sp. NPDC006684]|uniref:hypothetical protein n=1 Tax=Streptomyces sp. NPDC006684 TaxID=3154477 RepID=UPI003451B8F3
MDSAKLAPRSSRRSRSGTAPSSPGPAPVGFAQAEAALVEHYPRLVRLAHVVLPASLGRARRVLAAHALTQRALPRPRELAGARVPGPRGAEAAGAGSGTGRGGAGVSARDAGYACVRGRVLRETLRACGDGGPGKARVPSGLPRVWGLRLFPRAGGTEELALDQALSRLSGAGRAAYALVHLEGLDAETARALLTEAGAADAGAALGEAAGVELPAGAHAAALLASPEFDACSLQARPTDLVRRRQGVRAFGAGAAVLLVCGAAFTGWSLTRSEEPAYVPSATEREALDPARLTTVAPDAWETATRRDFSVWPARGGLVSDRALLGRALRAWDHPGPRTHVSATPGTPLGGPAGPPRLLWAGHTAGADIVLFYDGLRLVRYAEAAGDGFGDPALDLVRADGIDEAGAAVVAIARTDGNVRYLTAPWVKSVAQRDLRVPQRASTPFTTERDGTVWPFQQPGRTPAPDGGCTTWNTVQVTGVDGHARLYSDLGDLLPAHLTTGSPTAPGEVDDLASRTAWAPSACSLVAGQGRGVRAVNSWSYASQPLPEGAGTARWACTRMDTWRGGGTLTLAEYRAPGHPLGAVAAQAADSASCGPRQPDVLAGAMWKAPSGTWYVLAAGSGGVASITARDGIRGASPTRLFALPAPKGSTATLSATLVSGGTLDGLG